MKRKQPTKAELLAFAEQVANLTKDRECAECGLDGDDDNPECDAHEPFDMPSDDAVETLHSLISMARDMIGDVREPVAQAALSWSQTVWRGVSYDPGEVSDCPYYTCGPYSLQLEPHGAMERGGYAVYYRSAADMRGERLGWGKTFSDASAIANKHLNQMFRLCGIHRDTLSYHTCTEGFEGCEVERARALGAEVKA